ncbi:uncharacterized protein LOC133425218 isoform X2 [Cololabis saira]|uniref:uncharacterized protein LOC133425218 isoform X2 n=1 Tax=Cololabis saira TaxID=129043 RepID=UPI002AD334C4|nr:uncharacterized protein LOC133425218 isoform X2 [Cololabis saira]
MKFWICLFFILLMVNGVSGKADPYRKLGSSFVLRPDSVTGPLKNITWKHGDNLAVDWSGGDVKCYHIFKGHCSLNKTSGCLTLSNVTPEHSGSYTPIVNYEYENPTEIKIISPVPKPTVSSDCNDEKTHCNLTCEGNIVDDHGPVRPSWILGDNNVTGNKMLKITRENQERFITCVLENPVGFNQSEILLNPLIRTNSIYVILGVATTVGILGAPVLGGLVWCLIRKEKLKADEQNKTGRKEPDEPTVDMELIEVTVDDDDDDNSGAEPDD